MKKDNELVGLGGWLTLVGIGLVVSPMMVAYTGVAAYLPLFTGGSWDAITSADSGAYSPLLAALIIGEIAANTAFLAAGVFVAYLFFSKRSDFPSWFIGLSLSFVVFLLLDGVVAHALLPGVPLFDTESAGRLVRQIVYCLVWVPYMLTSRRVRLTFGGTKPVVLTVPANRVEPIVGELE